MITPLKEPPQSNDLPPDSASCFESVEKVWKGWEEEEVEEDADPYLQS
jgi:hypothetical protein